MTCRIAAITAVLVLMTAAPAMNARAAPNCHDYIIAEHILRDARMLTNTANEEVSRQAFFSFGAGSPASEKAREVAMSLSQNYLLAAETERNRAFLTAWSSPVDAAQRALPEDSDSDHHAAILEMAHREWVGCGGWHAQPVSRYAPNNEEYMKLRNASTKTRSNINCVEYVSAELRMNNAIRIADTEKKSALQNISAEAGRSYRTIGEHYSESKLTFDEAIVEVSSVAAIHWDAVVSAIEAEKKTISTASDELSRAELSAWANPIDAPQRRLPDASDEKGLATVRAIIDLEREYCKDPSSNIGTSTKI